MTLARVRVLERLGVDLVARSQFWLWNVTDVFGTKEPELSQDVAEKRYRYVSELLDIFEGSIGEKKFLAGTKPTVADFTVFPIFQTARERFNHPMGADLPRLDAWSRNFRKRPSADY